MHFYGAEVTKDTKKGLNHLKSFKRSKHLVVLNEDILIALV